jgi:hypothetical protein
LVAIKVYVEGGGDGHALRTDCRRGFRTLFEKAGLAGRMPRVVACGSRNEAFNDFCTALHRVGPGEFVCLLVDSEDPVVDGTSPWAFLNARPADRWEMPAAASDDNAHLMVQCMEAWFLADPGAIERFFGPGFHRNALPARTDVESIPRNDVFAALGRATYACAPKGQYRKGWHSFDLLASLDSEKVERASPYAARLFETLRRKAQVTTP